MYFEKKDNMVIKYDVQLDEEKLKLLRSEIIENCSSIYDVTRESNRRMISRDIERDNIRNYSDQLLRTDVKVDGCGCEVVNVYLLKYTLYKAPRLVKLIDSLIQKDFSVINEIFNPVIRMTKDEEEKIALEKEIITNLSSNKICNRIELINKLYIIQEEIKKLQKDRYNNKNEVLVDGYYPKVAECIKLEKIDEISINDFDLMQDFFSEIINKTKKLISKDKKIHLN